MKGEEEDEEEEEVVGLGGEGRPDDEMLPLLAKLWTLEEEAPTARGMKLWW